jgi:hypothetical protein
LWATAASSASFDCHVFAAWNPQPTEDRRLQDILQKRLIPAIVLHLCLGRRPWFMNVEALDLLPAVATLVVIER